MIVNVIALLLSLTLLALLPFSLAYPVDCSKFVFAPTCRGVIAKRLSPLNNSPRPISNGLMERTMFDPDSYNNLLGRLVPMAKESSLYDWD